MQTQQNFQASYGGAYGSQSYPADAGSGMSLTQWEQEVQRPAMPDPMDQARWNQNPNHTLSWSVEERHNQSDARLARWRSMLSQRPLNMQNPLNDEAIENPVSQMEVTLGGLKGLLARNLGHYVVATFVVGVSNFVVWRGILESVGNDYLVIYQPNQDRHVSCDFYSLKFIEFHSSYESILCDSLEWAGV